MMNVERYRLADVTITVQRGVTTPDSERHVWHDDGGRAVAWWVSTDPTGPTLDEWQEWVRYARR